MTTSAEPPPTTDALHMIRGDVDIRQLHRWMGSRGLQDPDHAMHCLLAECFGELAPRPFRLIAPRGKGVGTLYGYTQGTGVEALREAAAICADPLQCRILPVETLDGKPMPAEWHAGRHLSFETRVRPVIRHSRNNDSRPGRERDIFQAEAEHYPQHGMKRSREEVYADWLNDRITARRGAELLEARLVSFQRTRAVRKRGARYSEGPDALMRGLLTITDPAAFPDLLSKGIGRHRAYGFGMVLLRPARA